MSNVRSLILSCSLVGLAGCPGESGGTGNSPPVGSATDGNVTVSATNPDTTATTGEDTDASATDGPTTGTSTGSTTDDSGPTTTNCGDLQCSDNGSCEIDASGNAFCLCDDGYVLDDAQQTCVVDETCIQVSFLEDGCRQKISGEPAVALFFAVDFCAGTAVTPDKVEELGLVFDVRENDISIADNVESDATILDTGVESYVMLMVDVSNSITQSEDLPALVTELRSLVSALEAEPGEPDVYVSVYVFGFAAAEYVPFTRDLGAVDAALEALANDPAPAVELASGGQSTALFNATAEGIRETSRIRELRDAVSWGGVLTTGTVVVVTDGLDTSNADLDTSLIEDTTNQVISIGISNEIDDDELRAIGRDGSFLAPTPEQWTTAFEAIATRVDQYPERSYLLAYCSSSSEGSPDVQVGVQGATVTNVTVAQCGFNAELFSSQGFTCNTDFFLGECNAQACGGLTGCGACPDTQCCDGTQCVGPTSANQNPPVTCGGQIHTCDATNQTCTQGICTDALGDGSFCDPAADGCGQGVDYCGPNPDYDAMTDPPEEANVCLDALPVGSVCDFPRQCQSLNCYFPNPENPFEGRRCLPEARIGDHCGSEDAICEAGSYCQGSLCLPKQDELTSCNSGEQCRRGVCESFDTGGSFCQAEPACFWPWESKIPS